jgi:hypothetical protein
MCTWLENHSRAACRTKLMQLAADTAVVEACCSHLPFQAPQRLHPAQAPGTAAGPPGCWWAADLLLLLPLMLVLLLLQQ